MAGIYLHIPFCRTKCHYCNFFSTASSKNKNEFTDALIREISSQKNWLEGSEIQTVYFGGGTPSLFDPSVIDRILNQIYTDFSITDNPEITIEVNPDDITLEKLKEWKRSGFNRVSIGVQSFFDEDLEYLSRVHNSQQSAAGSQQVLDSGFTNVSADLIFGMPTLTNEHLVENIQKLADLGIPHISAYALTVEPKTALDVLIRNKKMKGPDEDRIVEHFRLAMETLKSLGYLHYEISNFGREGYFSRHNTMYWSGEHYLGLGPSAHSYNGISRRWNVANLAGYINDLKNGVPPYEMEILTQTQKFNEYIMTSLRTMWGCDLAKIRLDFGENFTFHISHFALRFIANGGMIEKDGILYLTDKGKLFADGIAAEMFIDEPEK